MPLNVADSSLSYDSLAKTEEPVFVIFYSSIVDGQLWCPDCRVVDGIVKDTFASNADTTPNALLIYVGDRPAWKTPDNVFRGKPWKINSVPTIVKLKQGQEIGRLVDEDIISGLSDFVKD